MKKLLTLCMLLCMVFTGAWAQSFSVATNTTNYNAIQVGHYYAFRECANNVGYLNGASVKTSTVSANQIYKIVDAGEGKVWLQCYGTSQYIGLGTVKDNGNKYNVAMAASTENAIAFTLAQRGNAAQVVLDCYPNGGSTKFWLGAQYAGASYPAHYQNSGTGNLSYWSVFEVTFSTMVEYTINYRSTNNHSWQTTYNGIENTTLSIDDVNVDFYSNFKFENSDLQLREDNKSFNVTCDEDFPFTAGVATRIQSRGDTHQDMDFYNGVTYPQYGSSGFDANANLWVFEHVPNSADLFTVKNVATGKYLTFQSGTRQDGVLVENPSNSGNNTSYLRVRKSTFNHGTSYVAFCLQHPNVPACCYGPHLANLGGWPDPNGETSALGNDQNCLIALAPTSYSANLPAGATEGNYGSIYLPYTMTLPEGIEAYAAAKEGDVLKLTKVGEAGAVIPAGAYILYSTFEESATLTLNETATVSAAGNELDGRFEANVELPTGSNYVLNNKDGVGFYKYSKATYPVAKAVFCAGESPVSAFRFDFETEQTTSIESLIQNMKLQGEAFDLQGRRLNKAQQGMNIINGHKVLVK